MPDSVGCLEHRLDRGLRRFELGSETAFVADAGREPALVQDVLEPVERLRADPQSFRERIRPGGNDHELLQVERVLGVRAAVDHVHHRHGQHMGTRPADPAEQRDARMRRPGLGGGERHAENRVGAEPGLVLRSVELDQPRVERPLVLGVEPHNSRRQLRIDIANGPENALAAIHALVAVAQLDGLELSGRRARRNSRASGRARLEHDVHLDRRISARVEDLAPVHACDRGGTHSNSSLARSK